MKKKRFTLPLALVLAGTIALGAGCGSAGGEQKAPVVTVQDGYVYVDGVKTDIQVNPAPEQPEKPEQKTAFELWKEDNPDYTGTEAEWLAWLKQLTEGQEEPKEEMLEYKLIENGIFKGNVTAGSAQTENAALTMNNAVLRLNESVVLPVGEDASWEIDVTGALLTGSATGAQLFAGNAFTEFGRAYIGANKTSGMVYIGVRMNTVYVNYGWKLDASVTGSDNVFGTEHRYVFSYEDGIYYLSLDGGEKMQDIFPKTEYAELAGRPRSGFAELKRADPHRVCAGLCRNDEHRHRRLCVQLENQQFFRQNFRAEGI